MVHTGAETQGQIFVYRSATYQNTFGYIHFCIGILRHLRKKMSARAREVRAQSLSGSGNGLFSCSANGINHQSNVVAHYQIASGCNSVRLRIVRNNHAGIIRPGSKLQMRVLTQVGGCNRIANNVGGYHPFVHIRVLFHIP